MHTDRAQVQVYVQGLPPVSAVPQLATSLGGCVLRYVLGLLGVQDSCALAYASLCLAFMLFFKGKLFLFSPWENKIPIFFF